MAATKDAPPQDTPEPDDTYQGEPEPEPEEDDYEPILELDTLVPNRPTVRIKTPDDREGKLYEMRLPQEFGVAEEQEFRSELRQFSELMAEREKLTSAKRKQLEHRVDVLCGKFLDAPPPIRALLNDKQKQHVITRFTGTLFAEDRTAIDEATQARVLGSIMAS